ncbi:hypothetical protein ACFYZE_31035 [Streptomyces sp. NPDC001796]|uniref:hypothetical protein n=1 Tax=Streptomyces sp. NPDC001796 TaxID=3364609 RepID=UPI003686CB15
MCTSCGARFTDERWQQIRQQSWLGERDGLCGPCAHEAIERAKAERAARRQAEEEAATRAEAEAHQRRGVLRRRL